MSKIFYTMLIALILVSCHKEIEPPTKPIQPPFPEIHELKGSESRYIYLNPNGYDIPLTNNGIVGQTYFRDENIEYSIKYASGLWIGMGNINEYKANISYYHSNIISKEGVFFLYKNVKYSNQNWPVDKGAPVDQFNNPRVYGDAMLWTSLSSNDALTTSYGYMKHSISGMQINKAIYTYELSEFKNIYLIKISIKNNTNKDWSDIQIGYFTDIDLTITNDEKYNRFSMDNNYLGYESSKNISYVYSDKMKNKYPIIGYSFLETPKNVPINSHRVMYHVKGFQAIKDEISFYSLDHIYYVLNGLSLTGTPMINPTTGLPTKFAFTGNPVTKNGWICTKPDDIRAIITTEPFSLRSGETTWCNLAFVFENESEFANSYDKLLKKFDYIKSNRQLWDFK